MIIGISGKIGSGKDTIGAIIQFLTTAKLNETNLKKSFEDYFLFGKSELIIVDSPFEIKKFADTLKDMVCLLINCTREDLENPDFKNKELPEMWWYYKLLDDPLKIVQRGYYPNPKDNELCEERYLVKTTPRLLLQLLGTECGRQILHPNVWINALMSQYEGNNVFIVTDNDGMSGTQEFVYPDWIITDMRFPNEMQAVKDRQGITIRVNRHFYTYLPETDEHQWATHEDIWQGLAVRTKATTYSKEEGYKIFMSELQSTALLGRPSKEHESETALDKHFAEFDYTITNNGSIEDLIEKVKQILIKEKII